VNESSSSSNFQLARHHLSVPPRNGAIERYSKYEPYELPTKHQLKSKCCLEQRQSRSTIAPIIQSLPILNQSSVSGFLPLLSPSLLHGDRGQTCYCATRSYPLPLHLPLHHHYYPCAESTLNVHSQQRIWDVLRNLLSSESD
jgi:hypothetical protein